MTRKIDVVWLLNRHLGSGLPAVLAWSVAILLLMPLIALAGVLALLATTALTVGRRGHRGEGEDRPAVLAPVVALGRVSERERVLAAPWSRVQDRAA